MKNIFHLVVTTAVVCASFTTITYTSCKRDKCKEVACLNRGYCLDGVCKCSVGYTGASCEIAPVDICKDVVCQNLGTCDAETGNCSCPSGYEGVNCETAIAAKYIGYYSVTEQCSISGNVDPFVVQITQLSPNILSLSNFGDYGTFFGTQFIVHMNITGTNTVIIPLQTVHNVHFSGDGSSANNILSITYSVSGDSVNTETCTTVWVKQ